MYMCCCAHHENFGGRVEVEQRLLLHRAALWIAAERRGARQPPVSAHRDRARIQLPTRHQRLSAGKEFVEAAGVDPTGLRRGGAERVL